MPRRIFKAENMTHNVVLGRKTPYGGGMGSVLLNRGGAGSGSSYSSPNEYSEITGRPLPVGSGVDMAKTQHRHLKDVNSKLQNLLAKPVNKRKNITFNI
jgi:hypothetical protein